MAAVGGLTAARKRKLNVVSGVSVANIFSVSLRQVRDRTLGSYVHATKPSLKVMEPKAELSDASRRTAAQPGHHF
jgi:hypothetical protein